MFRPSLGLALGLAERVGGRALRAAPRPGDGLEGALRAELDGAGLARLGAVRERSGVAERVLGEADRAPGRALGLDGAAGVAEFGSTRFDRELEDGRLSLDRRVDGAVRADGVAPLEGAARATGGRLRDTLDRPSVRPRMASEGRALDAVGRAPVARPPTAREADDRVEGAAARRAVAVRCAERGGVADTPPRVAAFAPAEALPARLVATRPAELGRGNSLYPVPLMARPPAPRRPATADRGVTHVLGPRLL